MNKTELIDKIAAGAEITNIAFSCESSNKKSRKVIKLLKIKCNMPIFWCFHGYFS